LAGSRLSLDTSEGSDVKSVYGVPATVLVAEAEWERVVGTEEASVNGEGGAVAAAAAAAPFQGLGGVWGCAAMSRDDRFSWAVASIWEEEWG
jgi:hypothetical protein